MILTVQSTTFSAYGGIPTYNRLVCRVLDEISNAGECHLLIATDKTSDIEEPAREFPHVRFQAFSQNRVTLILEFFRMGLTQGVDLALLGHVNYAPLGWFLKKLKPQSRYGVMLYGVDAWRRLPWLKRRALQQADFLISISDYTKQKAVEANALTATSTYLLPNALETILVEPPPTAAQILLGGGINLLSVCRLEETERYKGVDKVIEILPKLSRSVPDIQYVVVGGGTDLERHKRLAEKHGVAERVHFLGVLSNRDLLACYRHCDVFVMPSAGEGFGFVFLEAMKYGKPVVAANSGGAPEVIQDGITGQLVDYGNQEQLIQAITDLCLDLAKRERMGRAGYERVQANFTFPQFKEKLSAILLQELSSVSSHKSSSIAPLESR
ncbi:MAG TPA: glycosyltransferase family 4 protein [Pyrinomonadaceae bacterium]|nr:glycosyltransferase family 4 protein [Pyrinomonadaceae bacterium]